MKKLLVSLTTFVIIVLLILMQFNFLNTFPLFGISPCIGIVFICMVSIVAGEKAGTIVGFVYGIIQDAFLGRTMFETAILYMILGYVIGRFRHKIAIDNQLSLIAVIVLSTIATESCNFIVNITVYKAPIEVLYLLKVISIEIFYNLFLLYICYLPFVSWGKVMNRTNNSYYSLENNLR